MNQIQVLRSLVFVLKSELFQIYLTAISPSPCTFLLSPAKAISPNSSQTNFKQYGIEMTFDPRLPNITGPVVHL